MSLWPLHLDLRLVFSKVKATDRQHTRVAGLFVASGVSVFSVFLGPLAFTPQSPAAPRCASLQGLFIL